MPLTIIANIYAHADRTDFVKSELIKLIDVTRTEEGCITYELHQDNADPAHFMFYEVWESRELWQMHTRAAPLAAYRSATQGALDRSVVNEMTAV